MDVDAFVRVNRPTWDRLRVLTGKRRLTGAEATELVDLYQRTSTHLSMVRSAAPDPVVVGHLTQIVATHIERASIRGEHGPAPCRRHAGHDQ